MPFSAPAIEDGVAESPRLYASAFRSSVDRFKGPHAEKVQVTNLEYDIDLFETAAGVEVSEVLSDRLSPARLPSSIYISYLPAHRC